MFPRTPAIGYVVPGARAGGWGDRSQPRGFSLFLAAGAAMESSESRAPSAGPSHLLVWEADFKMAAHRHQVDWFDGQASGMLLWLSLAPATLPGSPGPRCFPGIPGVFGGLEWKPQHHRSPLDGPGASVQIVCGPLSRGAEEYIHEGASVLLFPNPSRCSPVFFSSTRV